MPRPQTQKAYVRRSKLNGTHCPCCGSRDIEGGQCDVRCGAIEQEITCSACHAVWVDVYALVSYELTLNPADEQKDEPNQ